MDIGYYVGIAILLAIPALLIYCFIDIKRIDKRERKILDAWDRGEAYYDEPPLTEIDGEIISKFYKEGFVGSGKVPKFKVTYFILFKDRYGKVKEYEVRKDQCKSFPENQKGTLAIVNGKVYDFK